MAGPIRIAIVANGASARREITQTAASATRMGDTFGKLGKLVAGAFAVSGLVRASAAIVKVGADYQGSLNKIQALTGANNATMKQAALQLEANASGYAKMGQTTGDAASGVVELTKAGLSLDKSLKAVRATMILAKAGELSVADASTLVSNTLNTFHLRASKAVDIANGLANAANISSADVADLAESFKFVAPIAAKAGISLDQTNAILAELANSGIKATNAGTGLRKFLLSLQAPVGKAKEALKDLNVQVFDSAGKTRPLGDIINDLSNSLSKLTDQQQSQKLRDIFGLTGITSAQIILQNGSAGLDEYTKGIQRAGAAQKLAEASSKGLMGTLNSLKASAISLAQSLYRQLSPAVDNGLKPLATWLSKNQDEIAATALAAATRLGPALASLARVAEETGAAFVQAGDPLVHLLLPTLDLIAKVAGTTADALDAIPDPLKSLAVEAGVAALVLPRLAAGATMATTAIRDQITYMRVLKLEMSDTASRGTLIASSFSKLGAVAKQAAGIAGLVALTQSAHQADAGLSLLEKTAGAAALGFSLGGPWGAAIGAVGGMAFGLVGLEKSVRAEKTAMEAANQAIRDHVDALTGANPSLADYKKTLDQVTGAITRATKASILQKLQQDQILSQGRDLGLSARTLVNATLGQPAAIKQVTAAWQDYVRANPIAALGKNAVADWIQQQNGALRENQGQIRANAAATADYSKKLLALLPKSVRTDVKLNGVEPSAAAIAGLATKYRLTPKQIRTLIQLSGADTSVAAVRKVQTNVQSSTAKIGRDLKGAGRVTTDMSPFLRSLAGGLNKAEGTASRGGQQVGAALKGGLLSGMSGMISGAVNTAAQAVIQAVAAAKRHGKISSPSKETQYIGEMLGEGLAVGLERKKARATAATRALVASLIKAAGDGGDDLRSKLLDALDDATKKRLDALRKYLDQHTKLTDSAISKKVDQAKKQLDRQTKDLVAATKEQRAALVAQEAAIAKVNDKLTDAKQALADVVQQQKDYTAAIKASVVASADITQVVTDTDAAITAESVVAGLQARADAVDQYVAALEDLKNSHLNDTTLQQLLDAGVSGGLATAQAIEAGGQATIDQINALTQHILAAGGQLGTDMGHTMFDAGIQAAAGLVKGLQQQKTQLEAAATDMANALVAAVKKGLQIHSPSRVFQDIGMQTVQGLSIGLDQTYVRRTGEVLASSLVKGFARPELTASAAYQQTLDTTGADRHEQERAAMIARIVADQLDSLPDRVGSATERGMDKASDRLGRAADRSLRLARAGVRR